jgi:hypothetical protein
MGELQFTSILISVESKILFIAFTSCTESTPNLALYTMAHCLTFDIKFFRITTHFATVMQYG